MAAVCPRLILGVGNLLRRDDGVGIHAVRCLLSNADTRVGACQSREHRLPAGAHRRDADAPHSFEIYDGGAGGLELAVVLARRERVVVIDAIDRGAVPGAIAWMRPEQLQPAVRSGLSLHDFHLLDALAELELLEQAPREVRVLTVQVADVSSGIGLSPDVAPALAAIVRRALRAIHAGNGGGRPRRPWTNSETLSRRWGMRIGTRAVTERFATPPPAAAGLQCRPATDNCEPGSEHPAPQPGAAAARGAEGQPWN
ncbi:Hydrogenase 2 maturation protease [Phycisphaerae bacterium RAS1]|nr:Hydrogenase 2 maturation protease [Phycisphaerae bacterium RAS1]